MTQNEREKQLLNQEWRDKYNKGIDIEFKSIASTYWKCLHPNEVGYSKAVGFNSPNYEYRERKQLPTPLLSSILKGQGLYEKILANLSCKFYLYDEFLCSTNTFSCIATAFNWESSTEGHEYWDGCIEYNRCLNDVRAPDDIDYWQEQYELNKPVFFYDIEEGDTGDMYEQCAPKDAVDTMMFYAEEPKHLVNNKKEETMEFKVGDTVRSLTNHSENTRMKGTLHTIGKAHHGDFLGYTCIDGDVCQANWSNFELVERASESKEGTFYTKASKNNMENNMENQTSTTAQIVAAAITASQCSKPVKAKKALTDFKSRKSIIAKFYDVRTGDYDCTREFKSIKQADKFYKSVENANLTKMVIYKESEVVSIDLPLTRVESK